MECTPLSDRDILRALYDATDGPGWTNSTNWLTGAPLAEWYGVRTDGAGRVVSLSLEYNGLTGSIPAELGNLASLRYLNLFNNELTGPIPAQFGNLANLEVLRLRSDELAGSIPP